MKDALLILGTLSDIGKQIVFKTIDRGTDLAIILADKPSRYSELQSFIREINIKSPHVEIASVNVDVVDFEKIEDKLSSVINTTYKIKQFVYIVGTNEINSAVAIDINTWDRVMNLNLKGFFFSAQYIGTHMMKNGGGNIVSIASQHGSAPNYDRSVYCASKAALIRLSEVLALEWAKYNIRVNTVSPTYLNTETNRNEVLTQAFRNKWLNSIPLHRCAEAEDVAEAVLFLLSDNASMITGHDLVVDGGWLLKHM
ncbi:SDR family NAD(P)-dependent oxidoreductase [Clostridium hydrogenum]|uniref:SDR family NAD(P)-dependent oxidoreductase n=1 Tax=Clostridium hydrogenum TaxID=2855764 RepID=UPI001F4901CD|nr:SDR family oxidoreductase [Clostridium hydrogenum]